MTEEFTLDDRGVYLDDTEGTYLDNTEETYLDDGEGGGEEEIPSAGHGTDDVVMSFLQTHRETVQQNIRILLEFNT